MHGAESLPLMPVTFLRESPFLPESPLSTLLESRRVRQTWPRPGEVVARHDRAGQGRPALPNSPSGPRARDPPPLSLVSAPRSTRPRVPSGWTWAIPTRQPCDDRNADCAVRPAPVPRAMSPPGSTAHPEASPPPSGPPVRRCCEECRSASSMRRRGRRHWTRPPSPPRCGAPGQRRRSTRLVQRATARSR